MNTYFIVILLFSISMTLFLLGYDTAFFSIMEGKYGALTLDNFPALASKYLLDWGGWLTVGAAITVGTLLSGLNFIALVPFVLAYVLLDLITLPVGLFDVLPAPLGLVLGVFFRLLTILVFISFVRSGN